ncbi:hypothetical protein GWK47_009835 [Chionoecetes opilio]|uniref:Uncharacterized protein n=1 Tax=Chionoecetes opilio TaxID=41210 RepID=A0A8J4XYI2_CHIOP|nr:hypothetical protein GWK47_009835 [Chionoecetes opilio]
MVIMRQKEKFAFIQCAGRLAHCQPQQALEPSVVAEVLGFKLSTNGYRRPHSYHSMIRTSGYSVLGYSSNVQELCRLLAPHLTTRILPVNKKVLATLWLLGNQESGQCQALLLRVLVSQQCQALLLLQQEPCQDQQLYKERYILAKKKCPTL